MAVVFAFSETTNVPDEIVKGVKLNVSACLWQVSSALVPLVQSGILESSP